MASPHVDASWYANSHGQIQLDTSPDKALAPYAGKVLVGLSGGNQAVTLTDATALRRSARWLISDATRQRHAELHAQLAAVFSQARVQLIFADGSQAALAPHPRGLAGLPMIYWPLLAFALALFLMACVVLIARPNSRNLVYALMALCQSGNFLFIAIEASFELGLWPPFAALDMPLRMGFDLVTAAAIVHSASMHPRRLPGARWIALAGWVACWGLMGAHAAGWLTQVWWWTQSTVLALGATAIGLLSWSYRIEPHPFAIVLRRFGMVTLLTLALLMAALVATEQNPSTPHHLADVGAMVWFVYLGAVMVLVPFVARSQAYMREFALLAATSTVATSLVLLLMAAFQLGQFASLALSLFVALAVYSCLRHWILNPLLGSSMLTTEKMFEQLYRMARDVEAKPKRVAFLLSQLLGELFEPLGVSLIEGHTHSTHLASDGSSMLVPVPTLMGEGCARPQAVMIRFAQRGRRLFTSEDARLTDRVVEQLQRAVQFDKAVEQGRHEERLRIAQDLHDDIGARLLTLMYKAQSPEMEDYARHTLQDLKTLTRGLADTNHQLSHATAEWKADLAHRLDAAHIDMKWSCAYDEDILLTVVHWSALTRILRELISNVISHSQAQHVNVHFRLEHDTLDLTITDDGVGRAPHAWSHGLGLSGVRKRVKQLGGTVEWQECGERGIRCQVNIQELSAHT